MIPNTSPVEVTEDQENDCCTCSYRLLADFEYPCHLCLADFPNYPFFIQVSKDMLEEKPIFELVEHPVFGRMQK